MAVRHDVPCALDQRLAGHASTVTSKRSRRRRHDVPCAAKAYRSRDPVIEVARHARSMAWQKGMTSHVQQRHDVTGALAR